MTADAEMTTGLSIVWHYNKCDMIVVESSLQLAGRNSVCSCSSSRRVYLHPDSNVYIAVWDLGGAKEDVSAKAIRATNDFHGLGATMGYGGVEANGPPLVATWGVGGPCSLVPAFLKIVRDLRER